MKNPTLTDTSRRFLRSIFPKGSAGQVWIANSGEWTGGAAGSLALDWAKANYYSPATLKPGAKTRSNATAERVYAVVADDVGAQIDPLTLMMELPEAAPKPFKVRTTAKGYRLLPGQGPGENVKLYDADGVVVRDNEQWGWRIDGGGDPAKFDNPTLYRRLPQGKSARNGSPTELVDDAGLATPVSEELALEIAAAIRRATPGASSSSGGPRARKDKPGQTATLEEVEAVLAAIDNSVEGDGEVSYDDWINAGIAVYGAVGEAGRDAWLKWSWQSKKAGVGFTPEDKWETFPSQPSAGFGALEIMARRYGHSAQGSFDDGVDLAHEVEAAEVGLGAPLEAIQQRVARWIAAGWGLDYRWNTTRKVWMEFTGDLWVDAPVDVGAELALRWARQTMPDGKMANTNAFAKAISAILKDIRSMVVDQGAFDRNPWLAGVPGGVLNLRSGRVRPARARDMITRQLAVAPAAEEDCPVWKRFMRQVTSGDKEVADFIQRWFGYCLTGDVSAQIFVYLWGPGGNGKGKTIETLQELLGAYCIQASQSTFIKKKQREHPEELARMAGSRLVIVPELTGGEQWNVDLLKAVTGDSKMTARFMYGSSFEFLITFKLMSVGNHQPAFPGGVNAAIERRFAYAEFTYKPPIKDEGLAAKFTAEMPGILRWALNGLLVGYKARKLERPPAMQKAAAGFFADVDPVLRWREENLEEDSNARTPVGDLFRDWNEFRERHDIFEFNTSAIFGKMLKNKGIFKISMIKGRAVVFGWKIKYPF